MKYTELKVWLETRKLVKLIYEITEKYPKTELYISSDLGFVNELKFQTIILKAETCKRLVNGFINYYKKLK